MPRNATLLLGASLLVQIACAGGESTPTVAQPIVVPPTVVPPTVAPTPTTGTVVVLATEKGNGLDPDGFSVTIDSAQMRALSYEAATRYDSVPPGEHTIRLDSIARHCVPTNAKQTLTVRAGVTDTVRMELTCIGGLAYGQLISADEYDIAYLAPDGRTIPLATGPGLKFINGWSPDGSRLLYDKQEGTDWFLYTVRADGTDTRRLPSGELTLRRPRWSPDGTRIAFTEVDRTIGASSIVTTDIDGGNRRVLVGTKAFDIDPVWSRDGTKIYFGCNRFSRSDDLCSAALDGSGLRAIRYATIDSIEALRPNCTANVCVSFVNPVHFEVSPDGGSILFELFPYNGPQSIWVGALDGSRVSSLSGAVVSFDGRWSPTGDRVVIGLWNGKSGYALATVKPDGSGFRQITSFDIQDEAGDFSPDGALIAFDGFRAGAQEIWVMNADGSGGRQVTFGSPSGFLPHWNPAARATGTLVGGQPSTATSIQPQRASAARAAFQLDATSRATACHPIRTNGSVRISCPGRP